MARHWDRCSILWGVIFMFYPDLDLQQILVKILNRSASPR